MIWKVKVIFYGVRRIIQLLPTRIYSFFLHISQPVDPIFKQAFPVIYPLFKGLEVVLKFLEIFGMGEIYQILSLGLKFNTRSLDSKEKALLHDIFGPHFPCDLIGIDERAFLGPPQLNICYVSFFTINSWKSMSNCLLVHEAVHTWQYLKYGIVYIPRALAVQRLVEGYNYGGISILQQAFAQKARLEDFNLEQQADIVADYCRIRSGLGPSWGKGTWVDLPIYQYFVDQLEEAI